MAFAFKQAAEDLHQVSIDAERVRLATITEDFTQQIYDEFTPEITRYMLPAPPQSITDTQAFMSAARASLDSQEELHLVITSKDGGEFLGICGLHCRRDPDEPELGIWIKKGAHDHGYGLEAISALKRWADAHIDFRRLIYPVDRRNHASVRIPVALGGTVIDERMQATMSGTELDELVFAIPGRAG
jgi:RimJ/RimL family protein N-acetyltransferase